MSITKQSSEKNKKKMFLKFFVFYSILLLSELKAQGTTFTYVSFLVDTRDAGVISELGPTPVNTPSALDALNLCDLTFPANAPVSAAQWNISDQTAICFNLLGNKNESCTPLVSDEDFIVNTAVRNFNQITVSQGDVRSWFPTKVEYGPGSSDVSHALPIAGDNVGDIIGEQYVDEFECMKTCELLDVSYDVYRTYIVQQPPSMSGSRACSCINALQSPVDTSNSFAFYVPNGNSVAIRYLTTTYRFPRTVPTTGMIASPTFRVTIRSEFPTASLAWAACRNYPNNGAANVQAVYWDGIGSTAICFRTRPGFNGEQDFIVDTSSDSSIFIIDNSVISAFNQPWDTCNLNPIPSSAANNPGNIAAVLVVWKLMFGSKGYWVR